MSEIQFQKTFYGIAASLVEGDKVTSGIGRTYSEAEEALREKISNRAEPSPEPEAAPEGKGDAERIVARIRSKIEMEGATPEDWVWEALAVLEADGKLKPQPPDSEAQAPAAPNDDHSDQAERDAEELANTYYKPHRFGDGPAWYAACVAACRELAQLRTRVAILDAQKVKLPDWEPNNEQAERWWSAIKDHQGGSVGAKMWYQCALSRERQLLDALRAIQAWRGVARGYRESHQNGQPYYENGRLSCPCKHCATYDALAGKGE